MSVRVCLVLFSVLIALACTESLEQPAEVERLERPKCTDYTFYAKYICKSRRNGEKMPVPGKCSQYYECFRGESIRKHCKKSCKRFFDFKLQKCTSAKIQCIKLDDTDCRKTTTSSPCTTVTPEPTPACTCPEIPTTTTRRFCPQPTCRPPICSTVYACSCPTQSPCPVLTTTPCPRIPQKKY
ncbi:uncharacterized protein LOC129920106 [Episyrphus balteatus]|uniref:uncharacterized protein LOC129920106 n=1 Tax=Episyrphus balteatus TaxID=286459 RepID=UPI002484F2E4|nr:uncharacterized protein LOC129920106 [Episyrphus balteatus]